jgi:hypothetical protein
MGDALPIPRHALLVGITLAALATVGMPFIAGYGTILAQVVGLNAWAIVASLSSEAYADQNHLFLWPIAAALNILLFLIVAAPAYFLLRRRAPRFFVAFVTVWLLFYVSCLFVLFPATDGP